MADGNAAIWGAVREVWPEAGEQRCWNHKMRNVLDRLPQREQGEAKDLLRAVVYAPSRSEAVKAREVFARRYRPWYPKAVDVLEDDWERMVAFYAFPEDHWKHLRTTNVVESPFAAVRLRTTAAKRFKRVESATALIWKLLLVAEKRFRRLDAPHLLKDVFEGRKFEDGKPVSTQQRKNAASYVYTPIDPTSGSGRRTPPENRSHSRSSGRERSRAREYRNAGRLGSLARPTRGRRPPWGPPARLSPPTMPRVTVAVSPAGWPRAKMSLPRVTSFAEPRERVRQSGSHWTSMSATSASSSERSTRTGTTRSLSNLARS